MGIFCSGIAQILPVFWNIKRQLLRFNRLYLSRFVLADAGCDSADAENGPRGCNQWSVPGRLSGSVGRVHSVHVLRYAESRARMLQFVFLSLTVLFALLAVGNIAGNEANHSRSGLGWLSVWCKRHLPGDG